MRQPQVLPFSVSINDALVVVGAFEAVVQAPAGSGTVEIA
jgi:hypothetical protein